MSGLFGGGSVSTSDTPLAGLTIQSSSNGKPIPIVYGTTRVTPNLLWYGDFTPIAHTQSQGGKGGGATSTTHTYTASFILGLCEGPVVAVPNAFIDKSVVTPSTLFSLFLGTYPQTPWSYLTSSHADQALGYQGIAYAAAASYDLANSANLPNHSFEVAGKLILSGTSDADPKDVINDLLTSQVYGVPNAPSIAGLTQYSAYCRAAGILISPCYDTQTAASQMITDLAQITNTGLYASEGVLKLVPYGDATLTGNGATYTPILTVIANLGDDDFLGSAGADPVIVKRNAIAATISTTVDAFNQVTVEFLDRANNYNVSTVVVQDQAAIDVYGLRPMPTITAHQIANAATANVVAMLILQRAVYVRSQFEFRLGWQWCYLEPTDLVTLTDTALGLNLYPVRILSVDEDEFGTLTVLAEDAPPGVSSHVVANVPINGGYNVNQAILPGDTNTPAIFEAPNALTAPDLQLWIAASGGTQWGGCEVWASSDGSTYRQIGTITSPARHGVLTASLPAGTDPDTTHALAVDLTACRGQLLAGTNADADAGNTMLWVDGELIDYSAATLTSAYHYSLGSYLRRGQKGTANATHASGAQFARLDDGIFKYTVPVERIGSPIYLKFPAFNVWGESKQSLASVAAYTHTFAGNKPNPLTGLTAVGGMFEIALSWTFTAGQIDRDFIEVWGATTNNRASAYLLSSVKNPAQSWAHPGLVPGQTWYYWARVVDTSGNDSDFYPLSSTAGIAAAPSADPSALLTQLRNSIGMGQLAAELAAPITQSPGALQANAIASIQSALSDYDLTNRMVWQENVTNATITVDPVTGKITLLATANVTTDVEQRLTAVEVLANADHGTLTLTVSTLSTVQGNLTSTQSAVTILQGQITSTATQVYVDNSVANATGAITTTSANAYTALANSEIQSALDSFSQAQAAQALTANVAIATSTLKATADAVSAQATSFAALVSVVAGNGAAITIEQTTRANETGALATRATALEASVNSGTTGLATKAAVSYVDSAVSTLNSAISSSASTLTAAYQAADTATLSSAQSYVTTYAYAKATVDSNIAASTAVVAARLDTGDYAAVKTSAVASASAITGLSAQWVLKVDVNGHVAGLQLATGASGASIAMLADKFLFLLPDGVGGFTTPRQAFILATVAGVTTLGLDGNLIVDGSVLARSINGTGLTITNGVSPSIAANNGTLSGYGAVFQGNGSFGIGSPTNNIVYDGTGFTINGQVVFNGNIVAKAATEFLSTYQWIPNATWSTYTFTMEHAGNASVLLTYGFTTSNILGTFDVRAQIDSTSSPDYYTGGDDGTVTLPTFFSGLSAGTHTLYMYASQQYATGSHLARMTLLRSYR